MNTYWQKKKRLRNNTKTIYYQYTVYSISEGSRIGVRLKDVQRHVDVARNRRSILLVHRAVLRQIFLPFEHLVTLGALQRFAAVRLDVLQHVVLLRETSAADLAGIRFVARVGPLVHD